jgi:hypothetical protein
MQPTAALTEAPETRELHQPSPEAGGPGALTPGGLTPGGARRLAELEETIREARSVGALYHPTNPFDAWFCRSCHVFGRGGGSCWCCGDDAVERQWVPRFGGGAETVTWEIEAA